MRKEIREEQVITKKEVFIAKDGKEFTTESECESYETSWRCTINASFKKIPQAKVSEYVLFGCNAGCEDYDIYLLKPRNLDDIRVINDYFNLNENRMFTQDDIGKECVVGRYYYETDYDGYVWKDGIEMVMNQMQKVIDETRNKLENFGKEPTTETEGKENAEN